MDFQIKTDTLKDFDTDSDTYSQSDMSEISDN